MYKPATIAAVHLAVLLAAPVQADLFITSQTDPAPNSVLRYDGDTGEFVGAAVAGAGLAGPLGLTFGPDGHLYVASSGNDQIRRYDGPTGAFLGTFATHAELQDPSHLTFGPDGHLYVSCAHDRVVRFDGQTGTFMDVFIRDARLAYPRGLKFGADGHLYVVSYNTATVLKIDGQTGAFLQTFVPARSGGLFTPSDLAFGPDGHLYVVGGSFPLPGVFRYDGASGEFLGKFATVPERNRMWPMGLAFGPDGALYVVTQSAVFAVLRFDGITGAFRDYFVPDMSGGLGNPFALAFSPDNPPVIAGPADAVISCAEAGESPVAAWVFDLDGDPLTVVWKVNGQVVQTDDLPASNPPLARAVTLNLELPVGTNVVEATVTDAAGHSAGFETIIVVEDIAPPEIVSASAAPAVLWPPNHQLVKVQVSAEIADDCGAASWRIVKVESDEPGREPPGRHQRPPFRWAEDWIIVDADTVWLRAEHAGRGSGRTYAIHLEAVDEAGRISERQVVEVRAPQNARDRHRPPIRPEPVPHGGKGERPRW